ncbi:MAG: HEPN domain-containing protein [Candidatus Micrarchaeota archaeon]
MITAKEWLTEAEADLVAAVAVAEKGVYARACFHCQQAVEKALKALLIHKKNSFPKTHSLIELAEKAGVLDKLKESVKDIDSDYVIARYGDAAGRPPLEIYDAQEFEKRLADARNALGMICAWMKN